MKKTIKKLIKKIPIAFTQNQRYDKYTNQIIERVCEPGTNCIDIGAHKGEVLDTILKHAPAGTAMPAGGMRRRSQRARDLFDLVGLDHVALADVVVALDRHAALEAFLDLAHVLLEALQGAQHAVEDHHMVAQEAHEEGRTTSTRYLGLCNHATQLLDTVETPEKCTVRDHGATLAAKEGL